MFSITVLIRIERVWRLVAAEVKKWPKVIGRRKDFGKSDGYDVGGPATNAFGG
jgi:hypothetical protein